MSSRQRRMPSVRRLVRWYLALVAWREVLQVQLQVAQVEAERGKSLAGLERAVGRELNQHPPAPPPRPSPTPRRRRPK